MIVKITIEDDNGNILQQQSGRVEVPLEWKCTYGSPILIERPNNQGCYLLHGFTYQPRITLNLQWRKPIQ
jgi:hypothetical protein